MSERLPLSAEEVVKAVERRRPVRVPMMIHFWNGPRPDATDEWNEAVPAIQREYPDDFCAVHLAMPAQWEDPGSEGYIPGYSWIRKPPPPAGETKGHDASVSIENWDVLGQLLTGWPNPQVPQMTAGAQQQMEKDANGRYVLACWWFCFFERLWASFRGMENLLCDFHESPESVHRLMDALCDFYVTMIHRVGREIRPHGIFTSDDIGMQTGPMFSPAVFREFFKPRYKRLIDAAHEHNMHFWLHCCGSIVPFMEDFIEIGLDVLHPIQKYTMDEREIAGKFGGRIAFWAGMDVQQTLPYGTPDDVRREVRFMIDTYDGPAGGCMITAGNGVTPDVPVENLRAFYDETYLYGLEHRRRRS